jgi:Kef-type K+ transport system membrane component KefB
MPPDWLLAIFDVGAIAGVAWVGGTVTRWLRQPRIAGEMTAVFAVGLLLGGQNADVAAGQQAGGTAGGLFPHAAVASVTVIGGLGLILYMLLVGITIDPAPMRERARAIMLLAGTSIASMVALALVAAPPLVAAGGWKPADVGQGAFVIALAAALAASGVPIIARIVEDRGMQQSAVGSIVIVAATCVTVLALIGSAIAIDGGDGAAVDHVVSQVGAVLALLVFVVAVARARSFSPAPQVSLLAVVALAVASALVGDWLLSSLLLGPLIVGVVVETRGRTAIAVEHVLGVAVRRLMLPVFLGLAALRTDLRELGSDALAPALAILGAVITIRLTVGYMAARIAGFEVRDARAIGALLQCGGVVTIAISLNALDAGVIDARMHATLTLVGLLTTIATGPLLPRTWHDRATQAAVGAASEIQRRPVNTQEGI